MAAKLFVNYRRDDDPNGAARIRDGLAPKFGKASIFMDVDNLLAGQRFDEELAKALAECDVLLAVIGPRWMELLKARAASGERDYVREEIAEALSASSSSSRCSSAVTGRCLCCRAGTTCRTTSATSCSTRSTTWPTSASAATSPS